MLRTDTPRVLQLADGELLRCEQPLTLSVLSGRVWLTRAGDLDDHFLDAGASIALDARSLALISAEGPAQVALRPRRRSSHALSAPPSRTAQEWAHARDPYRASGR